MTTETVPFCDVEWRIGERVGLMPMMRYARAVKVGMARAEGAPSDGMTEIEVLDATYSLLEQCVHPDDWDRFVDVTSKAGVDQEGYMEFAGKVMAALADRPTGRSSDSSDGPQTIEPSSTAVSSSPVTGKVVTRLNDSGRPDLALIVKKREEWSTASA